MGCLVTYVCMSGALVDHNMSAFNDVMNPKAFLSIAMHMFIFTSTIVFNIWKKGIHFVFV
jgi:hypothetical protein